MEIFNMEQNIPNTSNGNGSWVPPTSDEQARRNAVLTPPKVPGKKFPPKQAIMTEEALTGESTEPVEGVMSNEIYTQTNTDIAQKADKQFSIWKKQLKDASTTDLKKFVKFCEEQINTNPLVKDYPELIPLYRNLQAEIVSRLGEEMIHPVTAKVLKLKNLIKEKQTDTPEINKLKNEINNSLDLIDRAYDLRQHVPALTKDEEIKIAQLQTMSKDLRNNI